MDDFQKRWERIQQALATELSGEVKPRVSSGRTLFGIKSEGEAKMDEFARQIEDDYASRRRATKELQQKEKEQAAQNIAGEPAPKKLKANKL